MAIDAIIDVSSRTAGGVDWNQNGWENCVAEANGVVLFTYNTGAVYSTDGGNKFHLIDGNGLCRLWGESLFCDQVVTYCPAIDCFIWVMLTDAQNMVLAVASPQEIIDSQGTEWTTWHLKGSDYQGEGTKIDRPVVSFGNQYLYIACDAKSALGIRIPLGELQGRGTVYPQYIDNVPGMWWLRTALNTGDEALFPSLINSGPPGGQLSINSLRVVVWPENSLNYHWFDVQIPAVPTEGGGTQTPLGFWSDRTTLQIQGVTHRGNELWMSWPANRYVANNPPNSLNFPYPHIEIAIVDLNTEKLTGQRFIWNPDFTFNFPALATNGDGNVGMAFCWGGPSHYPQLGAGMLTGRNQTLYNLTPGASSSAGGDYVSINVMSINNGSFCIAGGNQVPPGPINHPFYVILNGED